MKKTILILAALIFVTGSKAQVFPAQPVLSESFNNTDNGWWEGKDKYGEAGVTGGLYIYHNKNKKSHKILTVDTHMDTNQKYYKVDAGMTVLKEYTSGHGWNMISQDNKIKYYGYGVVWGYRDNKNYYYFLVRGDGYYYVGGLIDGDKIKIKDWTFSKHINKGTADNKLEIVQAHWENTGHKLAFFINDENVTYTTPKQLIGSKTGFIIPKRHKIAVDYIKVLSGGKVYTKKGSSGNEKNSGGGGYGYGTGFFITQTGHIATNHHVIDGAKNVTVFTKTNDGLKGYKAKIVSKDAQNDLAILKVIDEKFKRLGPIPYGFKTQTTDVGTEVFAMGFPKIFDLGTEIKVTDGIISSKTISDNQANRYQISVPITHGNSGGPLFDDKGNVVGVTSGGWNVLKTKMVNTNFAIKLSYLNALTQSLPESVNLSGTSKYAASSLPEKVKRFQKFVVIIQVEIEK